MARVVLAPALARWLPAATEQSPGECALQVAGDDVGQVLQAVFDQHPGLRGYVLDEHGVIRHHVAVFVDGQALHDKRDLRQPVTAQGEVYVMQALSGG